MSDAIKVVRFKIVKEVKVNILGDSICKKAKEIKEPDKSNLLLQKNGIETVTPK